MTSNRLSLNKLLVFPVLMLAFLVCGCSNNKQIKGSEFVPHDSMVEMMVEMHLIDGLTNDVSYYRKFNPKDSIDLYGYVFEKHEVPKDKFYATLLEYSSKPKLLDKLYAEVLAELNLMQEELDKEKDLEIERRNKELGKETELSPKKRELKEEK